jgi:hypothetical protein
LQAHQFIIQIFPLFIPEMPAGFTSYVVQIFLRYINLGWFGFVTAMWVGAVSVVMKYLMSIFFV